jgi:hypothetical protein
MEFENMADEFPKLGEGQIIARDAEKIFEGILPSGEWVDTKVPQEKDFVIDYRLELVKDGKLKGCEVLVHLKGFRQVSSQGRISLSISTSTLRYWKQKILPVLIVAVDCTSRKAYFTWFDKTLEVDPQQKTQTVHVSMDSELHSYKLTISVQPFYESWLRHAHDKSRQAFYQKLYCDVAGVLDVLLHTFGRLLYAPDLADKEAAEHRDHFLSAFAMVFTKFLFDLSLYRTSVELQDNPIDAGLDRFLVALYSLQQQYYTSAGEVPGYGIGLYDASRLYSLLPTLAMYMTEITSFLRPHVLGSQRNA